MGRCVFHRFNLDGMPERPSDEVMLNRAQQRADAELVEYEEQVNMFASAERSASENVQLRQTLEHVRTSLSSVLSGITDPQVKLLIEKIMQDCGVN